MTVLVSSENTRPTQSLAMRRMGTAMVMHPLRRTFWHVILATWGRGQESIHNNGCEKEHDGEGNVKGSCLRGTGPAASRTESSSRPSGLRIAGSRLGDNEILVRLAVGLELHLVLVEGEFDAGVDGNQGLVGGLLLADVIVGGGRADNVFLAEEFRARFVLIGLGATVNGRFRNNRAGLRLFAGLDKARS